MFLVPVLDLQQGLAVHAVAGNRANYRPLVSCLTDHPTPANVVNAYRQQCGCGTNYLADLDALTGVTNPSRAKQLLEVFRDEQHRLIIAAETLSSRRELEALVQHVGCERLIFSLDLRGGKLNTPRRDWQSLPLLKVVQEVVSCGLERMIVLDLADVGVRSGASTLELVRAMLRQHPSLKIIAGGGVRNQADLVAMREAGCEAALVATALHTAQLTAQEAVEFCNNL
jgi:phosphoribosylformimino-5-aminoimidazole carboxamide ribotide isomerase